MFDPLTPPYGQPDRKISGFFFDDFPKWDSSVAQACYTLQVLGQQWKWKPKKGKWKLKRIELKPTEWKWKPNKWKWKSRTGAIPVSETHSWLQPVILCRCRGNRQRGIKTLQSEEKIDVNINFLSDLASRQYELWILSVEGAVSPAVASTSQIPRRLSRGANLKRKNLCSYLNLR